MAIPVTPDDFLQSILSEHVWLRSHLDGLKGRYSEPQRAYHTWAHIEHMLSLASEIKDQLNDPLAVLIAILWHDAIYDPQAKDNEEQSAELCAEACKTDCPEVSLKRACTMIRATAGHTLDNVTTETKSDCMIFLDIDLSILGADDTTYDQYDTNIRREYAHVPDDIYRVGRSAILSDFLTRKRLFFTDYFHEKLDAQARANLKRSLVKLGNPSP